MSARRIDGTGPGAARARRGLAAAILAAAALTTPAAWADGTATPFADLLLRAEALSHLPGGRDDFSRSRIRLRGGVRYVFGPYVEAELALVLAQASDEDSDAVRNFDNEETDVFDLDALALRAFPSRFDEVFVGRGALPVAIGPLAWDRDLRPFGAAWTHDRPIRTFDRLIVQGGWFEAEHPLGEGPAEFSTVQAEWRIRDGAPVGGAVAVGWTGFDGLDALPQAGLARTNRVAGAVLVSEYELLEVQAEVRFSAFGRPLRLVFDGIDNRGADDANRAGHGRIVLGDTTASGFEVGVAAQRVQRDAVLAAFADDDWWFKSAMRGTRVWLARGLPRGVTIRGAIDLERRDDLDERLTRVRLDATWRY